MAILALIPGRRTRVEGATYWVQQYDPLGSWPLSTLLAAVPILLLLGLLASGRFNAWQAALAGLVAALAMAVGIFGMPALLAAQAVHYGVVFALFRIVWLIVAAVFLYDLAVETGQFEVMKASIAQLSGDRRIQAMLVAFSFGAFIEGAAGFGAPVAISAAFLVGLGFRPFQAALLCLIANTAPVAWGAIGTPIRTLSSVTSLDVEALSATSGRILPFLSVIVPIWLVKTMTTWRHTLAVWPAFLAVGGTFAATQFLWSNYVGFELVDIISSVASLLGGVILLRFWRPSDEWRFAHEEEADAAARADGSASAKLALTRGAVVRAWMPFVLLTITVLVWGVPAVKRWFAAPHEVPGVGTIRLETKWPLPWLHLGVAKGEAVTGHTPTADDREKAEADIVPAC
jgi:lactate permease